MNLTTVSQTTHLKQKTIALIDDHQLFLEGLSLLIDRQFPEVEIHTFSRPKDAIDSFYVEPPDLFITDLSMPHDGGGMSVIQYVRDLHKEVPILVVSMNVQSDKVRAALQYGANGFVPKDAPRHVLLQAIGRVMEGEEFIPPSLQESLAKSSSDRDEQILNDLTFREKEILGMVASELANQEIADKLKISKRTVETHRKNIMRKLGVKNSVGLAKFAYRHGIAE
jgi:DNA-binding NarL/FixJ family response regulator